MANKINIDELEFSNPQETDEGSQTIPVPGEREIDPSEGTNAPEEVPRANFDTREAPRYDSYGQALAGALLDTGSMLYDTVKKRAQFGATVLDNATFNLVDNVLGLAPGVSREQVRETIDENTREQLGPIARTTADITGMLAGGGLLASGVKTAGKMMAKELAEDLAERATRTSVARILSSSALGGGEATLYSLGNERGEDIPADASLGLLGGMMAGTAFEAGRAGLGYIFKTPESQRANLGLQLVDELQRLGLKGPDGQPLSLQKIEERALRLGEDATFLEIVPELAPYARQLIVHGSNPDFGQRLLHVLRHRNDVAEDRLKGSVQEVLNIDAAGTPKGYLGAMENAMQRLQPMYDKLFETLDKNGVTIKGATVGNLISTTAANNNLSQRLEKRVLAELEEVIGGKRPVRVGDVYTGQPKRRKRQKARRDVPGILLNQDISVRDIHSMRKRLDKMIQASRKTDAFEGYAVDKNDRRILLEMRDQLTNLMNRNSKRLETLNRQYAEVHEMKTARDAGQKMVEGNEFYHEDMQEYLRTGIKSGASRGAFITGVLHGLRKKLGSANTPEQVQQVIAGNAETFESLNLLLGRDTMRDLIRHVEKTANLQDIAKETDPARVGYNPEAAGAGAGKDAVAMVMDTLIAGAPAVSQAARLGAGRRLGVSFADKDLSKRMGDVQSELLSDMLTGQGQRHAWDTTSMLMELAKPKARGLARQTPLVGAVTGGAIGKGQALQEQQEPQQNQRERPPQMLPLRGQ